MRLSTRRSISRAAVLGLLATTPLIGAWATADSVDGRAPRAPSDFAAAGSAAAGSAAAGSADLDGVRLAAFDALDQRWLDAAPAVDETLRSENGLAVPGDSPAGDVQSGEVASGEVASGDGASGDVGTTGLTADDIEAIDTSAVSVDVVGEDDPAAYVTADGESITADRVRAFLDGRDAPMADQAEAIVAAGITHDVDPRLVVGIAIAESNAGERLPVGSHNAWGWGGSGKFGLAHWSSWDEALDTYTERLGALYDTEDVGRSFAETYCPPNWQWWLDTVTWVIDEI